MSRSGKTMKTRNGPRYHMPPQPLTQTQNIARKGESGTISPSSQA
jgi:hypothetical protein